MDAQGPDRVRPYVQAAGATFTTLVDQDNRLGQLFGFRAIPNGILVDEQGLVRYQRLGGFDIRRPETADLVERWAAGSNLELDSPAQVGMTPGSEHSRSNAVFQKGMGLYSSGKVKEALATWREAVALDPDNYIIRKQIWAVENPERFYAGDIDYGWQRERAKRD